jgi:NADH-quinone oxidoreductase subunit G
MVAISPVFAEVGEIVPAPWGAFGADGALDEAGFVSPVVNFYMTDPVSRASATMAECTQAARGQAGVKTGTDG